MSSLRRGGVRVSMLAVTAVMAVAGAGLSAAPAAGQSQPDSTAAQVSPAVEPPAPTAGASRAAAEPTPAPAAERGDIVSRRGVPVRNVKVTKNGAVVTATVFWNQQMIARKGHRDRFNVRLAAFGSGGAADPVVLKNRSKKKRPPAVQKITIKLSKKKAKKLRASDDVVLAVSQQYGLKGTHHNRYFRQYVTVTKIKAGSKTRVSAGRSAAAASTRAGRDCSTIEIRPGADLSGCDLSRANISICDLTNVNLSGAILSGAVLNKCNLNGAQLADADLAGVSATGLTGTPASLPDGWTLANGTLVPPTPGPGPVTTAPAFTSADNATADEETAMTPFGVTTTGVPDAAISITAGTLPTGVGLVDNGDGTATISGTPADGTAGAHVITLTAANGITPDATQTFTLTVAAASSCVVGATGPGGGTIFYDDTVGGMCYEAAPDGWNGGADPTLLWGEGSTAGQCGNLSITTGTAIGTGATNTTAITTTAACDTPAEAPAAWAAENYTNNSLSDWFLPSQGELNQLCKYARGQSTAVENQAVLCDSTGTLQSGFTEDYYWSSSQWFAADARAQYFALGDQAFAAKSSGSLPVRPVRAF